ncbi:MAG: hypothetical protein GX277_06875 [Bacteroidales bacterium]|nr:hypothetical protein [Bacteroidales bacterium]
MKKTVLFTVGLICSIAISSCGTKSNTDIANKHKTACLEDEIIHAIYGDKTDEYCNCIFEKISNISEKETLTEEKIKEITQTCADKYTSLDTDF